ncbi:MAG: hypothetical protein RL068_1001 [Actinomycetota bacterium]
MTGDFGGFDVPGGANDMANQKDNESPWFRRWYVWVLPLAVLADVLVYAYN